MIDKCFLKMFPHTSFYSSFCSYLMAMKLSSVIFELVPQKLSNTAFVGNLRKFYVKLIHFYEMMMMSTLY